MRIRRLAAVALLALGACATEENFRKAADAYVGRPEAELVARLGAPDATHRADAVAPVVANTAGGTTPGARAGALATTGASHVDAGAKLLTWRRAGAITMPGYVQCVRGFCWVTPPQSFVQACEFTARIEAGVVRSYTYQGNGCRV